MPRIHLGHGKVNLEGWINIDARTESFTHICDNGFCLNAFAESSIGTIYMCHVLEHFSHEDVLDLIQLFYSKLVPGGCLILSVPDFDVLVDIYLKSSRSLSVVRKALMGGQTYAENFHKSLFTRRALTEIVTKSGFIRVSEWSVEEIFGSNIGDWSSRKMPTPNGPMHISLNIKCFKP
jgi:predicted SAM-dependent methyltransferase